MRILILFCFFATQINLLSGQNYTISGYIKLFENQGTGGPISVKLSFRGSSVYNTTDHQGRYVFEVSPSQIKSGDETRSKEELLKLFEYK